MRKQNGAPYSLEIYKMVSASVVSKEVQVRQHDNTYHDVNLRQLKFHSILSELMLWLFSYRADT